MISNELQMFVLIFCLWYFDDDLLMIPCFVQQLRALLKENISRLSKTVTSVLQPYIELFRNADYCMDEVCHSYYVIYMLLFINVLLCFIGQVPTV